MKILHLISDPRLVESVSKVFAGNQDWQGDLVVLCEDFCHLRAPYNYKLDVNVVVTGSAEWVALKRRKYDGIWVHGASQENIRFVLSYVRPTVVIWSALGPDYMAYLDCLRGSVAAALHWMRRSSVCSIVKRALLLVLAKVGFLKAFSSEHQLFFRRVDCFAALWPQDGEAIRRILRPGAEQLDFSYLLKTDQVQDVLDAIAALPCRKWQPCRSIVVHQLSRRMRNQIRIRFAGNGAHGRMSDLVVKVGQDITLPPNAFALSGYCFAGWSYAPQAGAVWPDQSAVSHPPTYNGKAVLFAQWRGLNYRIRFNPNGGNGEMRDIGGTFGSETHLPPVRFKRPMYDFAGWALSPQKPVQWLDNGIVIRPPLRGGIAFLYAKWIGRPYTLRFDACGGSGTMPEQHFIFGTPASLPLNAFERKFSVNEFEFMGWSVVPGGKVAWKDGGVVKEPVIRDGIATLYAVWRGFEASVRFDCNGGVGDMPEFKFCYGQLTRLPKVRFSRPMHVFSGWMAESHGKVLWKDCGWLREPPHREGRVILYAKWVGVSCRLVLDPNGGEGERRAISCRYDANFPLPRNAFTRKGYSFMGWSTTPNGPVQWKDGGWLGDGIIDSGETIFYARWSRKLPDGTLLDKHLTKAGLFGPRRPMRILHIVGARLLVDGIINTFESIPETRNRYVLFTNYDVHPTAGIKRTDALEIVRRQSDQHKKLVDADEFDVVWAHGAGSDAIRYALTRSPRVVIVWSSWGYDYVDYVGRWWHSPQTTLQWIRQEPLRAVAKRISLWLIAKLRVNRLSMSEHGRFYKRVDVFSCVISEEIPYLRSLLGSHAQMIYFAYLQKHDVAPRKTELKLLNLDNKAIWVGNSATLTNNYWDLFPKLVKSSGYEVIASLVYGPDGMTRGPYADSIEKCGRSYLGDRFTAITEFMPLAEYMKLMNRCSVFVFGQLRQQAMGNMFGALKQGGCVVLNRRGLLYAFCIRKGFRVYTLEDLDQGVDKIIEDFRSYQKRTAIAANKVANVREVLSKIRKSVRQVRTLCNNRNSSQSMDCAT